MKKQYPLIPKELEYKFLLAMVRDMNSHRPMLFPTLTNITESRDGDIVWNGDVGTVVKREPIYDLSDEIKGG